MSSVTQVTSRFVLAPCTLITMPTTNTSIYSIVDGFEHVDGLGDAVNVAILATGEVWINTSEGQTVQVPVDQVRRLVAKLLAVPAVRCPDHFVGAEKLVCLTCGAS